MISCNIVQDFGEISSNDVVSKRLSLISWNDAAPVFDIRTWHSDGRPLKGVTLSTKELLRLKELINDIEIDETE